MPNSELHKREWGTGDENTAPRLLFFQGYGQQQWEESGQKNKPTPCVLLKGRSFWIFLKIKRPPVSCRTSLGIILISPEITHTRNPAQLYCAPFSDGKKTSVKNRGLRAKKRGGSMLDMVNMEKTPVFEMTHSGWLVEISCLFNGLKERAFFNVRRPQTCSVGVFWFCRRIGILRKPLIKRDKKE